MQLLHGQKIFTPLIQGRPSTSDDPLLPTILGHQVQAKTASVWQMTSGQNHLWWTVRQGKRFGPTCVDGDPMQRPVKTQREGGPATS